MSNKRIELSGTFYVGIADENVQETNDYQPQDYSKCDTLTFKVISEAEKSLNA